MTNIVIHSGAVGEASTITIASDTYDYYDMELGMLGTDRGVYFARSHTLQESGSLKIPDFWDLNVV